MRVSELINLLEDMDSNAEVLFAENDRLSPYSYELDEVMCDSKGRVYITSGSQSGLVPGEVQRY